MSRENMKFLYHNCITSDIFNSLMHLPNNINHNLIKVNLHKSPMLYVFQLLVKLPLNGILCSDSIVCPCLKSR